MPSRDPAKLQATRARYREKHRKAIAERKRAAYAANPEAHRARQQERRREKRDEVLAYNRAWGADYRARLRAEMLQAYGSCCRCCGEREPLFLQLDHVDNDGHVDRRAHKTTNKLLAHLKRSGWPQDRYQLLCANCNFGKMLNGGVCPHAKDLS